MSGELHINRKKLVIVAACIVVLLLFVASAVAYQQTIVNNTGAASKESKADDVNDQSTLVKDIEEIAADEESDPTVENEEKINPEVLGVSDAYGYDSSRTQTNTSSAHTVVPNAESDVVERPVSPPPEPVRCNKQMKQSYTDLYNSQIAAENARWSRQIDGFNSEAARRNMYFSGYVQSQIDVHKPYHDSVLAGIEASYYENLAAVNCL